MGYSNFKTLKQVTDKFALEEEPVQLFPKVVPCPPSDWLLKSLEIANRFFPTNEKAKSESIIFPILSEIYISYEGKIGLYSGEELNISPQDDLNGPCDFFFSQKPKGYILKAPIIAFAEAKDEDLEWGLAQCTAQMYAARIFNEREGKLMENIYGCATTGDVWKFLKLHNKTIFVDTNSHYLDNVSLILGVFHQIIREFVT